VTWIIRNRVCYQVRATNWQCRQPCFRSKLVLLLFCGALGCDTVQSGRVFTFWGDSLWRWRQYVPLIHLVTICNTSWYRNPESRSMTLHSRDKLKSWYGSISVEPYASRRAAQSRSCQVRLPPRRSWCVYSSGMLYGVGCYFVPTFRENVSVPSSRVEQFLTLEHRFSRNVSN
jgi:hypothetical protein